MGQRQVKTDFDRVANPGRVGPLALTHAEIEPLDRGAAAHVRGPTVAGRGKREWQAHRARDVPDRELALSLEAAITRRLEPGRLEARPGPLRHVEKILAAQCVVAFLVARVG